MNAFKKGNTGEYNGGDKYEENTDIVEKWEIVNSHRLVNYESRNCTSYNHNKSAFSLYLRGVSTKIP